MVKVLKPGFYTTVQDLGRLEFQVYGVPISGAMDSQSAKIANALVGNDENDAVLEITLFGPKLEFHNDVLVSLAGAELSPTLNNKEILMNTAIRISKGDVLSFGKLKYGCRCYLAVSGGFQTENIMLSRSMYKNITSKFRIEKGDELKVKTAANDFKVSSNALVRIDNSSFKERELIVCKGPEFHLLTKSQKEKLLTAHFTIAKENSRMAYQLEEVLDNNLKAIITSLVLPGTVQLTPSGKLIILMKDCQTTGGYPRVLQLSESSINSLAQKFTGSKIKFTLIN